MKILYVAPSWGHGGVEHVVRSVALELAKRGHTVTVLAGGGEGETWEGPVRVVRWPTYTPSAAYHIPKKPSKLAEYLAREQSDIDVIHVHNVHAVFSMYAIQRHNKKAKIVLTPHYHGGGHTPYRKTIWPIWRLYIKKKLSHVDVVHNVSPYEHELFKRHFGIRGVVIQHGVDDDILNSTWTPQNYAMWAGRIEKYKNIEKLAKVVKTLGDITLKIVGDGPHREALKKTLHRLKVPYEISPPLPRKEYVDALSKALFLGNLSKHEAFGLTALEATAMGTPAVVAAPWGYHYADNPRALVVDPDTPESQIAEKIRRLIDEAPKRPRPPVETWSQVATRYLKQLYD